MWRLEEGIPCLPVALIRAWQAMVFWIAEWIRSNADSVADTPSLGRRHAQQCGCSWNPWLSCKQLGTPLMALWALPLRWNVVKFLEPLLEVARGPL